MRLPHPWDSPGKNTGVGCYFLSNAGKRKVRVKSLSRVRLLATPWTAAHQAPSSMGFSRQEYWSGVPLPVLFPIFLVSSRPSFFFPFLFMYLFTSLLHYPSIFWNSPQITGYSRCSLVSSFPSPMIGFVWVGSGPKLFSIVLGSRALCLHSSTHLSHPS